MRKLTKILVLALTITLALITAEILNRFVFMTCGVPTGSMQDTIKINDRLIVNRLSYINEKVKRGDIVAFKYPDDPSDIFIKRVIGTSGDIIDITDGKLYLNNKPQDEPYIKEPMNEQFGPYKVPQGCYFMLGDNRNISDDSRYWQTKYVPQADILGKVIFRYYPICDIGSVN